MICESASACMLTARLSRSHRAQTGAMSDRDRRAKAQAAKAAPQPPLPPPSFNPPPPAVRPTPRVVYVQVPVYVPGMPGLPMGPIPPGARPPPPPATPPPPPPAPGPAVPSQAAPGGRPGPRPRPSSSPVYLRGATASGRTALEESALRWESGGCSGGSTSETGRRHGSCRSSSESCGRVSASSQRGS